MSETQDFKIQDDVRTVPTDSIKPNDYNPNEMSDETYKSLKLGIAKEGFIIPVVVQKSSNIIIDGEHRHKAAVELGMKEILVQFIDVDDNMAQRLTVALDNRKGVFNKKGLQELMLKIKEKTEGLGHLDFGFTKNAFKGLTDKKEIERQKQKKEELKKKINNSEKEFLIMIECKTEDEQATLFSRLTSEGINCRVID